jgi:hypothetical protein
MQEILRAFLARNPSLHRTLEFLFSNPAESLAFRDLRIQPIVASHRNQVSAEPFLLPAARFGSSQDVPMVPLVHNAVDEALRAYSATRPHFLEYVGKTPMSAYGSMGLSVARWGYVDWDYIRDLDWRIFLPPEIGQLSGFKSELERILTQELLKSGFHTILGGKDEQGQPQVQLRDPKTAVPHGFHFFLIAMKPGFARGNIHHDGSYSPHFAYFPEGAMDEHLQSANLLWSDLIAQQREDYVAMFNQLSFNIFGENSAKDRLYKTRGWYLHKAFKWYATLARMRRLSSLEEDLLYEYEHYRGSEAELAYFARYRYYARMNPSPQHLDDVDRDLARTASIAYAQARNRGDRLVGRQISVDGDDIILLEPVPEDFRVAAHKVLIDDSKKEGSRNAPAAAEIRFADNLAASATAQLEGVGRVDLIPAEWSMVFCEPYIRRAAKAAAEEHRSIQEPEIREAIVVLLASLLPRAQQFHDDFSGSVYI